MLAIFGLQLKETTNHKRGEISQMGQKLGFILWQGGQGGGSTVCRGGSITVAGCKQRMTLGAGALSRE